MVYFLDLQSAFTEINNMNKTQQRLPKQQQMNNTKLNPTDTQHQLLGIPAFNTDYIKPVQC